MRRQICVAQLGYVSDDISEQVERVRNVIVENKDADLIVFPELILHGHPSPQNPEGLLFRRVRVSYRSISESLYRLVQRLDARVVIGELKRQGDRYLNLATYVSRELTESYVKTHVHWTENFVPGTELKVFDTPGMKIGVTICFDAAFPEVWRVLSLRGAQLGLNISAVPQSFPVRYMWRRLRSAALNNQIYVAYANRPDKDFSGHSAVFSPHGECLAGAEDGEEILNVEIDLQEVEQWREAEQLYPFRRPRLYHEIGRVHGPSLEPEVTPVEN